MVNTKKKFNILLAGIVSVTSGVVAYFHALPDVSAVDQCSETATPDRCNLNFQVNVVESLSVTVTTPHEWASGATNTFLRNKVNLSVSTSNSSGYTASMYSNNSTTNLSDGNDHTIPTLGAVGTTATRGSFPANKWGYSLGIVNGPIDVPETDGGRDSAKYAAMSASTTVPNMIRTTNNAVSNETTDIYFGAKADATQVSGTYTGDVIISVVTGTVNPSTNPVTPSNPVIDTDVSAGSGYTYVQSRGATARRTVATNVTPTASGYPSDTVDTNKMEIIEGNYTAPLGVTTTTTATNVVSNNNALATGLAVTAAVAATSGILFFIAGKRDDDDEEEEA